MKPRWKTAIIGAVAPLLFGAGIAVAPIAAAVPFAQGCGEWPEPPCSPGVPKPATQSDPNGAPYWWEDSTGRHWCPPECLTH